MRRDLRRRRGATVVEFAVIAPVLLLLLFGLVVGALGIFRYHQVANLAREAARYASVHGQQFHMETAEPAATEASIKQNVVLANAAGLDPARLNCTVTWDANNAPVRMNPDLTVTGNIVIVTVSYQWVPEGKFFPTITLSSTSKVPMSY